MALIRSVSPLLLASEVVCPWWAALFRFTESCQLQFTGSQEGKMLGQFTNTANKVPALQRFFQANPNLLIFEKTAQDQTVYKFMMTSGTLAFFGAVFGIGQLATASGKKAPRS
eukprot:m.429915 g.429915  ORF g.429915 m.429915 type:complete len:113 (-) comp17089_c0_seq1:56-394(-)